MKLRKKKAEVVKYHCSLDRKITLCGRSVTLVDYVNARYWDGLKACNRCRACLRRRPVGTVLVKPVLASTGNADGTGIHSMVEGNRGDHQT